MRKKLCSLWILSLAAGLLSVTEVHAQLLEEAVEKESLESSEEERRTKIMVVVDLSELKFTEEERAAVLRIRDEVLSKSKTLLIQEGYDVVAEGEDARLEVHMKWKNRETFLQGLWVEVKMNGEEVKGEELSEMECAYCTKEDLAKQTVTVLLPAALEVVKKKLEERKGHVVPVQVENGNGQKPNGEHSATDGQKDKDPLKGPRGLQVGGWVTTGVGAGMLGAGIGMWVKGKATNVNPNFIEERTGKDYTTPGTVMVGVGSALLITGVVMVAVDYVQTKKAREKAAKKKVQVAPAISQTSIGLSLTSRF